MKSLFAVLTLLGGLSSAALADDPSAVPGADRPDCSELKGKEKRMCEKGANDPDTPPPAAISGGDRGDCSTLEGDAREMCEKGREGAAPPEAREARDCTGLEGEELETCERFAAQVAGEGSPPREGGENPPPSQEKGGKAMQRSNDGNMESYEENE